jgi:hypothetical protein
MGGRLNGYQRDLLVSLEERGPQVVEVVRSASNAGLWDRGLIERHGARRFRITEAGREALATPSRNHPHTDEVAQ